MCTSVYIITPLCTSVITPHSSHESQILIHILVIVCIAAYCTLSLSCYRCLVAVVTYCVVGVAYNYRVKGERGSDIIPNAALWVELPVLVKVSISSCLPLL